MKRSTQVALLLMGATGVGASAYAMAPTSKRDCVPANQQQPPAASTAAALSGKDGKTPEPCPTRRSYHSSSSGYYRSSYYSSSPSHWSTPIFGRGAGQAQQTQAGRPPAGASTSLGFSGRPSTSTSTSTSTARSTSTRSSTSTSSSTSRGGFGSTGSSVASHSSSS